MTRRADTVVTTVHDGSDLLGVSVWGTDGDEAVYVSEDQIPLLFLQLVEIMREAGMDPETILDDEI